MSKSLKPASDSYKNETPCLWCGRRCLLNTGSITTSTIGFFLQTKLVCNMLLEWAYIVLNFRWCKSFGRNITSASSASGLCRACGLTTCRIGTSSCVLFVPLITLEGAKYLKREKWRWLGKPLNGLKVEATGFAMTAFPPIKQRPLWKFSFVTLPSIYR